MISVNSILLQSANVDPAIIIAHAGHMKETYLDIQIALQNIHYEDNQWNICAD